MSPRGRTAVYIIVVGHSYSKLVSFHLSFFFCISIHLAIYSPGIMFAIGPVAVAVVSLIFGLVHTACQSITFLSFCDDSSGKSAVVIRAGLFSLIVCAVCTLVLCIAPQSQVVSCIFCQWHLCL